MNSKAEAADTKLDTVKLVVALLIVCTAMAGFYIYAEQSLLYRVIALLAGVAVAVFIAAHTGKGRRIWSFFQDAQIEVRKVVWPTRQETIQTTLIVILVVIIVSLILWLLDMFLGWSIGLLIGR